MSHFTGALSSMPDISMNVSTMFNPSFPISTTSVSEGTSILVMSQNTTCFNIISSKQIIMRHQMNLKHWLKIDHISFLLITPSILLNYQSVAFELPHRQNPVSQGKEETIDPKKWQVVLCTDAF
jgi:hypothetical protein